MSITPQMFLSYVAQLAQNDSPAAYLLLSNLQLSGGAGDFNVEQRKCIANVLAWARDRETDELSRYDIEDCFNLVANDLELPAVTLALLVSRPSTRVDSEDAPPLQNQLDVALARSNLDLKTLLRESAYKHFAAPYWLSVVAGLTRTPSNRMSSSIARSGIFFWLRLRPQPGLNDDILRERRVARRTLRYLLDLGLVDDVSATTLFWIITWSLESDPTESDMSESLDLVVQLRNIGLLDVDTASEPRE